MRLVSLRALHARLWHAPLPPRWAAPLRALGGACAALLLAALDRLTGALRRLPPLDEGLALATACVAVLLAARVAAAVHRWRLGNSDLTELAHAARDVLSLACSFLACDASSASVDAHVHFAADLKRWLTAYVALALHDCRCDGHGHERDDDDDDEYELIAEQLAPLLDDHELAALRRATTSRQRAAVVELWLRCRVSSARFTETPPSPLLGHDAQAAEIHRAVAALPRAYQSAVHAWRDPPAWGPLTRLSPLLVLALLAFYAVARVHALHFQGALEVFAWGLALFGLDAAAHAIENRHISGDDGSGRLEPLVLVMQDDMDASLDELFRARGGLEAWRRWNRRAQPTPRQQRVSLARPPSQIWPSGALSPSVSPSTTTHGDNSADGGVAKPTLKHVLDLITTSSPPRSTQTVVEGEEEEEDGASTTTGERRPLLSGSSTPRRYDLFLRRDADDDTEDEEIEDEARLPV